MPALSTCLLHSQKATASECVKQHLNNQKTVCLYISLASYQLLIISQEYSPFRTIAISIRVNYTTSTLAVLSALDFKTSQAFRLTGGTLQGDKLT
ncbi:hypothetical protein CW735_19250 [Alteromonas sp. MB-3u-76]|nr:hypothetical protein CW735_19250 [Alteromonas sp. MB-3u-76]